MMYILTISFNSSPKQYQYLLDLNTKIVPKVGDTLQRIEGCYGKSKYSTELHVVSIKEANVLPNIVTSVIVINNSKLECVTHTLSTKTIETLRASSTSEKTAMIPPTAPAKKGLSYEERLNIIYQCIWNSL